MPLPPAVNRSSGSRVRFPTTVTVLSAMAGSYSVACLDDAAVSGRRLRQAAACCLGIGKPDELVADDVVGDAERPLEVVEGATRSEQLVHDVVAVFLLVDRVGILATAPPVGLAVDRPAGLRD